MNWQFDAIAAISQNAFDMAESRPQRQKKISKRLINEISEVKSKKNQNKKLKVFDKSLNKIKTKEVDQLRNRVKVHFKG